MGTFKTFLLGVGTAYAVYIITRKGSDGQSILDDLLDNPSAVLLEAKNYAIEQAIVTAKREVK